MLSVYHFVCYFGVARWSIIILAFVGKKNERSLSILIKLFKQKLNYYRFVN